MAKKAKCIIALELSKAYLKLVEYLPGEKQIVGVAIHSLEPSQWENETYLTEQVREAANKFIRKSKVEVIASIPGEYAVIRNVEIPNEEIDFADAIQWEMEQYLLHPLEEYLFDYQNLGSNQSETAKLFLVAAYRKHEIEKFKRVLAATGFEVDVLDVDVFAAQNAFEANYPDFVAQKTFIVKADAHSIKCIRNANGQFLGLDHIVVDDSFTNLSDSAKEDMTLDLVHQVRSFFDKAQEELGDFENIILCGDLSLDQVFKDNLTANLPLEVLLLNSFKRMTFSVSQEKSEAYQESAPQCAAAVGLALRRRGDS